MSKEKVLGTVIPVDKVSEQDTLVDSPTKNFSLNPNFRFLSSDFLMRSPYKFPSVQIHISSEIVLDIPIILLFLLIKPTIQNLIATSLSKKKKKVFSNIHHHRPYHPRIYHLGETRATRLSFGAKIQTSLPILHLSTMCCAAQWDPQLGYSKKSHGQ